LNGCCPKRYRLKKSTWAWYKNNVLEIKLDLEGTIVTIVKTLLQEFTNVFVSNYKKTLKDTPSHCINRIKLNTTTPLDINHTIA
jgi:hypothetical protein